MDNIVYSTNTVREAVRSRSAKEVFISEKNLHHPIVAEAKEAKIKVTLKADAQLTAMAKTNYHQGFVAFVAFAKTFSLKEIIASAKTSTYPLIVMLDGIQDPHNLGAILRSCDAFGVDGLIMKNRNEVPLNATVARVSTGAIDYVKVATVSNLSQAIAELKDAGYWIVSTDGSADVELKSINFLCPICLVVGSEGEGISRLVLKNSDFVAKIPMRGHVNSLNASVSAGIAIATIDMLRR